METKSCSKYTCLPKEKLPNRYTVSPIAARPRPSLGGGISSIKELLFSSVHSSAAGSSLYIVLGTENFKKNHGVQEKYIWMIFSSTMSANLWVKDARTYEKSRKFECIMK